MVFGVTGCGIGSLVPGIDVTDRPRVAAVVDAEDPNSYRAQHMKT